MLAAVVVTGESGVGKSALAVRGLTASGETAPAGVQALSINLRHVPKLTAQFQDTLGCPLSALLGELSAPQRMLIVDAADAVTEGREDAFRYLVDAAQESDVKVLAITSVDSLQVVKDTLTERYGLDVAEFAVKPLSDSDIDAKPATVTLLLSCRAGSLRCRHHSTRSSMQTMVLVGETCPLKPCWHSPIPAPCFRTHGPACSRTTPPVCDALPA